jgi:AraC family transcriptional regulator, regulatory protein of adaptative response / methylated-DNA-[protein]-cysteine methyltransferase
MDIAVSPFQDVTPEGDDYAIVCKVVEMITQDYRDQPSLEALAGRINLSPSVLQKTFTRWAGLSPKAFLQAVTLDHAKRLLGQDDLPLLEASIDLGLSGPGRLHDLFVTHEAMSPGEWKLKGAGLTIRYGFHASPFGVALVMVTERGLAGLAFNDAGAEQASFDDMAGRWPNATFIADPQATSPFAARIFDPDRWAQEEPLRIVLIGSDFQVRVWERLLKIPFGRAMSE